MISGALWLLLELTVLFFGVAFLVQLVQRRLGGDRVRAWMGGPPIAAALKGIAIGFITPFCTYSAIPMLVGMRQAGVPPAGYVAFLSAAPVLDPVLFGALAIIAGVEAALIYTGIAFIAAMVLALTAQRVGIEQHLKPLPAELVPAGVRSNLATTDPSEDPSCATTSCGIDDAPWQGLGAESIDAARAATALLRSVGLLLLVGVGIGLLIEAAISPDTVATVTGDNTSWSIPVAAILGTPLYVQTSVLVPIAHSLTAAGVGIGAIVALTISGAGANVPEFVILTKLADRKLIGIFFAYVFLVALAGGLTAQLLLG
ncbi:MAG: uncharacterized membrane protein YraQ (UPF0718 family) [Verrucomicrobiales bacterium]|jgi:uncharacterized membrane protein YraQ (UPF0718 family)